MMRLLWLLLLLTLGSWLAAWALSEQGYVAVQFAGYLIETSVSVLTLMLLVLAGLGLGAVRLLSAVLNLPARWRAWRERRQLLAPGKRLEAGVMALAVGDAGAASDKLAQGEDAGSWMRLMLAAQLAQASGNAAQRDRMLAQALKLAPEQGFVIRLLQARWLLAEDPARALAIAEALLASYPRQRTLRSLYAEALAALGRWQALEAYLPNAKGALPKPRYLQFRAQVHAEHLRLAGDRQQLSERWQGLSRAAQTHPLVAEAYVTRALAWGGSAEFWPVLARAMDAHWEVRLLPLLAQVAGEDLYAELKQVQSWLQRHGSDAGLWWLSGVLAARVGLAGQAEADLRKSLELAPSAAAALALSDALARDGRAEAARGVLRDMLGAPAGLPRLTQDD